MSHESEVVKALTVGIASTYHECDTNYMMQNTAVPKRILTRLAEGVRNDGFDNADGDYICKVGDVVYSPEGLGFEILDKLGSGTFGQVLKSAVHAPKKDHSHHHSSASHVANLVEGSHVALKIIKNKPAYYQQGLVEVKVLDLLNRSYDLRVVKMVDYFVFRKHLCIVFELLSVNLYDVIRHNSFRGLPYTMVRSIVDQLVRCLVCLKMSNVLHCDLKPENILLLSKRNTKIKLIDFGSASCVGQQVYTYIQSRFYRSIDVLLGLTPFTPAIDMWSLGCIIVELFTGMPVFPGQSEYDQLSKITELMGPVPAHLLDVGKHTKKFYSGGTNSYKLRSKEEYEEITGRKEKPPKKHTKATSLREMVLGSATSLDNPEEVLRVEKLLHLAKLCLEYDPQKRVTPAQAVTHPYFDDAISAVEGWVPRSDEFCVRLLVDDPSSFLNNSKSISSSSNNQVLAEQTNTNGFSILSDMHTPVKQLMTPLKMGAHGGPLSYSNPLQQRNSQSILTGLVDQQHFMSDSSVVSFRPQIQPLTESKPAHATSSILTSASPASKGPLLLPPCSPMIIPNCSPMTSRNTRLPPPGIPFSPMNPVATDCSPAKVSYHLRPRAQSDTTNGGWV